MKKLLYLILGIFIFSSTYSQIKTLKKGFIFGTVVDQQQKALPYTTVSLYNADTLIDGKLTDTTGRFVFKDLEFGKYDIEIKFIGFKKKKIININVSADTPFVNIGKIEIIPDEKQIKGVRIVANKSNIEYKIDKKIVYPSKDLQAAGGTAADALRSVPSVQVDIQGNVSLRGSSNFQVLINGKPTVLNGSEALKQIPANSIVKIEIITNPSAKYDPDGVAGIINIITKKGADQGFSGKIELTADNFNSKGITAYIRYKKRKTETLLELNYLKKIQILNYSKKLDIDTNFSIFNHDTLNNIYYPITASFSMNYFINDNNTLELNIQAGQKSIIFNSYGIKQQEFNQITSYFTEKTDNNNTDYYTQAHISFDHKTQNSKINTFIQYSYTTGNHISTIRYDTTNNYFMPISNNFFAQQVNKKNLQQKARYQIDYQRDIKNGQIETGIVARLLNTQNNLNFQQYSEAQWIILQQFSYNIDFVRTIAAAYFTFSNKLAFLHYKIGLRTEYTNRSIQYQNNKNSVNRIDWFPSVHLSAKTNNNWNFQLGYSRRINRPNAMELINTPLYLNANTIMQGNPELMPELTNSYEFNIMKKFSFNSISLETYIRDSHNPISQVQMPYSEDVSAWTWLNADNSISTGAELSTNLVLLKMLMLYLSTDIYNYQLKGYLGTQQIVKQSVITSGKAFLMTMLPTGTMLQVGGFLMGKDINLSGERSPLFVSMGGIRQSLFKKRLDFSFTVIGLFNKIGIQTYSQYGIYQNTMSFYMPTNYIFTLSYRIGKFKEKHKKINREQTQQSVPFVGTGVY